MMLRAFVVAAVLGACVPVGYEYDEVGAYGYPPAGYIATATPVYYGGYPHYWYGGRWYMRGEGGWRTYRTEPEFLRTRRAGGVVVAAPRANYGRGAYYGHATYGGGRHR
jgi:hypothetical protein